MGMTIEEAINHIKYGIIENNYPLQRDLGIEACNLAIDTMRKYQKIEDIVRDYYNEQYTDKLDIEIIEMISEVLCDGNDV